MNREQVAYLSKRIKSIADEKLAEIPKPPRIAEFELNFEERYKQVVSGKAKLKPLKSLNHYTDFKDAYIFLGEEEALKKHAALADQCKKRMNAIELERDKLLDKVNLGSDAEDFIKLLTAFSNKKF